MVLFVSNSNSNGFNWKTTVASMQFSKHDIKYPLMGLLLGLDMIVIQSPPLLIRVALATLLVVACMLPYIRQFAVPALPIFTWLITFYACQFVPLEWRPDHIFVNILPTLERILYGANLSEILSRHTHPVLDILAWLPYGVIHFSFPFILSLLLFVFGPPGALPIFGQAFGYMNLFGVLTQLFFPNASPWYEMSYGSTPADYTIPGEAGGLARIDHILGLNLYGSTFGSSPLVFGAFPSLHSGCATIEMAFVTYLFPKLWPLAICYTMWLWWSTMYLTHHYFIDLVAGSTYALTAFYFAHLYLPAVHPSARTRLDYLRSKPSASVTVFLQSIEPERNLQTATEDEESMLGPEEKDYQQYPLSETRAKPSFRHVKDMEEVDADSVSNISLISGCSSSLLSEPSSPLTPRSPFAVSPTTTQDWK